MLHYSCEDGGGGSSPPVELYPSPGPMAGSKGEPTPRKASGDNFHGTTVNKEASINRYYPREIRSITMPILPLRYAQTFHQPRGAEEQS